MNPWKLMKITSVLVVLAAIVYAIRVTIHYGEVHSLFVVSGR